MTNTGTFVGDVMGVYFDDPGASESGLTNSGLIVGNSEFGIGVYGTGVTINNQAGGTIIAGEAGIYLEHGSTGGTITNSGFIGGTYATSVGIYSTAGGSVTNFSTGLISGGVRFTAASGLIVNSGSIVGNGSYGPVELDAGGTVTNLSSGRISAAGTSFGVKIQGGAGTVINAGQILGGADAVTLGSGFANRVIDDPGAYFKGIVDGGNAVGGGAISTTIAFGGASGDILALSSAAATANTVSNVAAGQTIEITGQSVTTANLVNGDTLQLGLSAGGPLDIKLDPGESYTGNFFHASNSGGNSFVTENTTPCYTNPPKH